MKNTLRKLPVTVLTGFLGAGKTTLLNRVLTEQHGMRIAVIENEFGEVGIDHELVINSEEEIFEMNNGCICCTVRGDLIRILARLMKRQDKFDHILIETTGLADPGPVVQTFFVDDEINEQLEINAVITLVDAHHIDLHLDSSDEAKEQIAFADVIILNKSDLVMPADLDRLEARIKAMNGMAKIYRTTNSKVEMDKILNVGGFNLDHAIGVDPRFLEPEYPFEWGGILSLPKKPLEIVAKQNPDPSMKLAIVPVETASEEEMAQARETAVRLFSSQDVIDCKSGVKLSSSTLHELVLNDGEMHWPLDLQGAGYYAFFTEHYPEELDMHIMVEGTPVSPETAKAYKPDHEHDETVSSVGIEIEGECDEALLQKWLSRLLSERGTDIFRMKGVFAVSGDPHRVIFQGVHMILDAQDGGPWGDRKRQNILVFIGRNLDREELNSEFSKCLK
ncbi:MAG: GTP-binding protein [Verrucomicrobiota bacterium]